MATINHAVITGGSFTQVNNNFNHAQPQPLPTPWDRLQTAVAPVALHNSAERFDPPRCHPNTRVAVMDELIDWVIRRGNGGNARVLWLSGPAGAGKSAIAQSLCELCFSHKFLLASFFFNRSDSSRNNAKRLVGTITSQIYAMVPRQYQSRILDVVDNDPLVFDRSIEAQFKALIIDPLHNLFEDDHFNNYDAPRLIVIDGLDECSPRAAQVNILKAVQTISTQRSSPFVFLIASRPEHDIQMFFRSAGLGSLIRQLDLGDSYLPDLDIELFLKEKLKETCATHPLKESIPQGWPPSRTIERLVEKSSGQFIYASVVIKYVTSSRQYPPIRLEVVLGLRPPRRDLPFAELDTLYSHILSSAEDINLVLQILRVMLVFQESNVHLFAEDIEQLCGLDQGDCLNALCDLQSVIQIRPPRQVIHLLHKSLSDYLQDPSRSSRYYVDATPKVAISVVEKCFQIMADPALASYHRLDTFLWRHSGQIAGNIQWCHEDLMSFSLITCQKPYYVKPEKVEFNRRIKVLWYSFRILDGLCALEGTEYEYVYHHHLHQFPELASYHPQLYGSWSPANGDYFFYMIMVLVLLGHSGAHILSEGSVILQPLYSLSYLSKIPDTKQPAANWKNLIYAVAQRCINSLMHDRHSTSAVFALECLSIILPSAKLSADLNEACHSVASLYTVPSTGRVLAYDWLGRSFAEMGYTDEEMHKMTREFERGACVAIQGYTKRYENGEIPDTN